MKGVFITGTDTGVGKTTIAAALASMMRRSGIDIGVMKPFASADTVFSRRYKSEDSALLARAAQVNDPDEQINPFFYSVPTAPFIAAKIEFKTEVRISTALKLYHKLAAKHDFMIVEGIGGIMVPLAKEEYVAHFAKALGLSTIIVASSKLGMINHTLLTIKACNDFGIKPTGIIINSVLENDFLIKNNVADAIQELTSVKVLATVPFLRILNLKNVRLALERNVDVKQVLMR